LLRHKHHLLLAAFLLPALSGAALAAHDRDNDNDADDAARITTIAGLNNIQQIGSTENILDANGNAIMANPNPYKVVVSPERLGNFPKGSVLVTNIGNDGTTGTTVVKFQPFPSTGVQFNAAAATLQGPADIVFNHGRFLVANSKGGNNVSVLNPDGTLFTSITDPLFNNPWGVATGDPLSFSELATFFVSNKGDAKLLRVNVHEGAPGAAPTVKVTQIGQLTQMADGTKIDMNWVPILKVNGKVMVDVLVVDDPANNRIAAIPNASTSSSTTATGTTIFTGTPLNLPGGTAINPFNKDILVVNLNDNNAVEINPANGKVVATKTLDPLVVDAQGNNAALFGLTATRDKQGNLLVYYVDDNTNSLNVLSAAPIVAPAAK